MKRSYPRMTTARPGDCPGTGTTIEATVMAGCPVCGAMVALSRHRVVRHVPPDDPQAMARIRARLDALKSQ